MLEFLSLCFSPVNLPFTLLLILVFVYWMTVVSGIFGLDSFDIDLDADVDVDFDADADLDGDAEGGGSGSAVGSVLRFFNVGDVPLMIIVSFFVFSMWAMSLLGNEYAVKWFGLEPGLLVAAVWLVPNVILSLLLAKVLTMPFRAAFKSLKAGMETRTQIVGKTCVITTSEVTRKFGQAELPLEGGPPLRLNVRADPKEQLGKGDTALVVSHKKEGDTYEVIAYDVELDGDPELEE